MRTFALLVVLGCVGGYAWQQYYVQPPGLEVTREADASRPFVVKVHADSCAKCVNLGPTWTRLDAQVGDGARLVVLDVTNEERFGETKRIARYLGLTGFLRTNMQYTGTVAVLHGETREPVEHFDGETGLSPYLRAIERARGV